jgi:hypothetical protein
MQLAEARVPADSGTPLNGLWDSLSTAVVNAMDPLGWILPALILTLLFLGAVALVAWWLEDLPVELEIFQAIGGIFKWTRKWWRGERTSGSAV